MKPFTNDDLDATIEAPMRPEPPRLPNVEKISTLRKRHLELVEQYQKAVERRDDAIGLLMRREEKVRDARRALARSTKRIELERMSASDKNDFTDDAIRWGVP